MAQTTSEADAIIWKSLVCSSMHSWTGRGIFNEDVDVRRRRRRRCSPTPGSLWPAALPCAVLIVLPPSCRAFMAVEQFYFIIISTSNSGRWAYIIVSSFWPTSHARPSPSCMPEAVLVGDLLRCPAPHSYRSRWPLGGHVLLLSSFCYAGKSGIEAGRFFDIDYRHYLCLEWIIATMYYRTYIIAIMHYRTFIIATMHYRRIYSRQYHYRRIILQQYHYRRI